MTVIDGYKAYRLGACNHPFVNLLLSAMGGLVVITIAHGQNPVMVVSPYIYPAAVILLWLSFWASSYVAAWVKSAPSIANPSIYVQRHEEMLDTGSIIEIKTLWLTGRGPNRENIKFQLKKDRAWLVREYIKECQND